MASEAEVKAASEAIANEINKLKNEGLQWNDDVPAIAGAALEAAAKARGEMVVYEARPPGLIAANVGEKFVDWLTREVFVIRKAREGGK